MFILLNNHCIWIITNEDVLLFVIEDDAVSYRLCNINYFV